VWNKEIKLWASDHGVLAERVLVGQVVAHDRLQGDLVVLFRKTFVSLLEGLGNQRGVRSCGGTEKTQRK
jgi:hypothetical protein